MTDVFGGFLRPTTTPTPDELFDVWLSKLSGSELKVLLYIVRRTFGFQKEADAISLSQICEGITTRDGRVLDNGTGLTRTTAYKTVQSLEKHGLIQVDRVENADQSPAVNVYSLCFWSASDDGKRHGSDRDSQGGSETNAGIGQESTRGGLITNPGVGQELTQGGLETNPGVGQKLTPQQTALQETVSQQTEEPQPPPPSPSLMGSNTLAVPVPESFPPAGGEGKAASEGVLKRSSVQLALIHPPPATHPTHEPVREDRGRAVDTLVAFGVWRARAEQLVDKLGLSAETVDCACAALSAEMQQGAAIVNRGAVLAGRLEAGWEPPPEPPPNPYAKWGVDDEEMTTTAPVLDERPPLPPVVTSSGAEHNAYEWFADLKDDLQMQLARETYDTWLRPAELVGHAPAAGDTPATLTIRLHNLYAKAWIEHRLHKILQRQAVRMLGKAVRLVYVGPEEAETQPGDPPWWAVTRSNTANTETERSAS